MAYTYNPGIFNVPDISWAKKVILTPEDSSTEARWQLETPYVADLISQNIPINFDTIILDYGCGIGRMAKELIARHQCYVIGVDISTNMLQLAYHYVQSDRFCGCSPIMLDALIERGQRFDAAISIWVLQHCLTPAVDIARLKRSLKPDGGLFVLNNIWRAVPTVERGWANDGLDIKKMLAEQFAPIKEGRLPADKITKSMLDIHYWAALLNKNGA
jgi:SAM-dependent methyltransferase